MFCNGSPPRGWSRSPAMGVGWSSFRGLEMKRGGVEKKCGSWILGEYMPNFGLLVQVFCCDA